MLVVNFELPILKYLRIEMRCQSLEQYVDVIEPEGLKRDVLIEQVLSSSDQVWSGIFHTLSHLHLYNWVPHIYF